MPTTCSLCSAKIMPEDAFCSRCGGAIAPSLRGEAAEGKRAGAAATRGKRFVRVAKILIFCGLLTNIGALIFIKASAPRPVFRFARIVTAPPSTGKLMACSPEGTCFVTITATFDAHTVRQVVSSPYATRRVSDQGMCVWDTSTGKCLYEVDDTIQLGSNAPSRVAFSPDSKRLATAFNAIDIRETATGAPLQHIPDTADCAAFSLDGKYVAVGRTNPGGAFGGAGANKHIVIHEIAGGREVQALSVDLSVNDLAYSPDSKYLLTGKNPMKASLGYGHFKNAPTTLWEAATGREVISFDGPEIVTCFAFSPDSQYFATGDADNVITIRETQTGHEVRRVTVGVRGMTSVSYSPDGRYLLTTTPRSADVWLAATGAFVHTFKEHDLEKGIQASGHPPTFCAVFSPDSRHLVVGGNDATLYEVSSGQEVQALIESPGGTDFVLFSQDGRTLLIGSPDKRVDNYQSVISGPDGSKVHVWKRIP